MVDGNEVCKSYCRPLFMRSEECIRELCTKVVAASDTEVQCAIAELKKALRERKKGPKDSSKPQAKAKILA